MFTKKRKLYSQNFLCNRQIVEKLVRNSSIGAGDDVLEIGAGEGVITVELLKVAKKVVAVEIDQQLFGLLRQKLRRSQKLRLIRQDFLTFHLPATPYKVFGNIPFGITGDVVRKLLHADNPPSDCYLVMQTEAADKFVAKDSESTMSAILYHPWWNIGIEYRFKNTDFSPQPAVNAVLIRIKKRDVPMLESKLKSRYQDFVVYSFNKKRSARFLTPDQWIVLFHGLIHSGDTRRLKRTNGAFVRLVEEQKRLQKIHRTRTDKNWRRF